VLLTNRLPAHPVRIVVADHNDTDRETTIGLLNAAQCFRVNKTSSADGLMDLLAEGDVDCVIIDRSLGAISGFAVHDEIKKKYRDAPAVIMLTGSGNEDVATKAFRCGLDNYMRKASLRSKALSDAILGAVDRKRDAKLQTNELEYLARLALRDRMTGLPNRKFLDDRLAMLIASGNRHSSHLSRRGGTDFAILLIDMMGLGSINDRFGHAVGDAALKAFADRLRQVSRASDFFGRFGGDEFLYLIDKDVSVETTDLACRRLIEELSFSIDLESVGLSLSCIIGAAIYRLDGETAGDLVGAAELALQSARSKGGGYRLASVTGADGADRPATSLAATAVENADIGMASLRKIAENPGEAVAVDERPGRETTAWTGPIATKTGAKSAGTAY
jgi:diguanylate cyclase (GGDEF)-like protein